MSLIFINIMERPISDKFSTFVFNNIMEVPFIFSPLQFFVIRQPDLNNPLFFNDIHFNRILGLRN